MVNLLSGIEGGYVLAFLCFAEMKTWRGYECYSGSWGGYGFFFFEDSGAVSLNSSPIQTVGIKYFNCQGTY